MDRSVDRPTQPPDEVRDLYGGWVWAGELGFDFGRLTVTQTRRIAPFVVHAVWRRDMGPLLLIHSGKPRVEVELRRQKRSGEWAAWAPMKSKRHGATDDAILLALRAHPDRASLPWSIDHGHRALPWFEPGNDAFDSPRCIHEHASGKRCGSPAASASVYCP